MCVDTETADVFNNTVTIPGSVTEKNALKEAKAQLETNTVKVISVTDIAIDCKLYAMTEADFIAHAEIIGDGRINTTNKEG